MERVDADPVLQLQLQSQPQSQSQLEPQSRSQSQSQSQSRSQSQSQQDVAHPARLPDESSNNAQPSPTQTSEPRVQQAQPPAPPSDVSGPTQASAGQQQQQQPSQDQRQEPQDQQQQSRVQQQQQQSQEQQHTVEHPHSGPSSAAQQDASRISSPAQGQMSHPQTPVLPPMNFHQQQPQAQAPQAPQAQPQSQHQLQPQPLSSAPAPAAAHLQNGVSQQQQQQQQHPSPHMNNNHTNIPPPPPPLQQQQQRQQHQTHQTHTPQHHPQLPPPPPHHPATHNTNGTPAQYQPHAHSHAAPPPPPPSSSYSYSPEASLQQAPPNGYGPPHMGYQMPVGTAHMSPGQAQRHKKEIKRRTKTGCLTCRKRRIKCDEGHPTCRNCQKSKRECLGYDPVFKSQTQPQIIQPAPGLGPGAPTATAPMAAAVTAPHTQPNLGPPPLKQESLPAPEPQRYSNVPQGYMPAASAGYSPASVLQPPMDFGPAIDPALGPPVDSVAAPPQPAPPPPQEEYTTSLHPQRNVKHINVESLFSIDGIPPSIAPPRDTSANLPPHELDMIRNMYNLEYAAGLDRFLETTWYTDQGFNLLAGNVELLHYFSHCLYRFQQAQNGNNLHGITSVEARLVWQLACLPRLVHSNPLPPHVATLLQRLDIIQHILCGTFMQPNLVPMSPPPTPPDPKLTDQYAQYLQDAFWHQLGRFVSIHDDVNSPDAAQQIATALAAMRNILSMLENRDVLYSMAIARHFGGRMVDYHQDKHLVSRSAEPDDPIAKLAVAMNFIRDEDSQGTTQVVQRLCGMCKRSWLMQRLSPPSS